MFSYLKEKRALFIPLVFLLAFIIVTPAVQKRISSWLSPNILTAQVVPPSATTQTLFTGMGGSALPNSATTIYSALTGNGGNDSWATNTNEAGAGSLLPAGTLNSFRFTSTYDTNSYDVGDVGANIIATVMKNGTATTLTCTVTGAAGSGAAGQEQCGVVPVVANPPISVSAGDRFTVRIQMQGNLPNPGGAAWSTDFTPSISNTTVMAGSHNTGNPSARYLPPGVSTYTANFGVGASTDADGRVVVPISGNITGILCRSSVSRTTALKTEVYVNGSAVGALDCNVPANSTSPVLVTATRALAVGDTVSLKFNNNGSSGMIFATLLFAPTTSGKWWGGFSSGPAVVWGQYTAVSPLNGYARTTCTWNGTCDTWPPPYVNIDSMRVDLGTVPTGGQTLAISAARHIEDPPGLNSVSASALRCSFTSGSANSCTVNGPVSVDAINNNDYWELWLNHTGTPNSSTLKVSTVYSSDLSGGAPPPPPPPTTITQFSITTAVEGGTPGTRLFTITISAPGAGTPLVTRSVTAVGNTLTVTGLSLTPGTYDIRIRPDGYLFKRITTTLSNNANIAMQSPLAGNLNNDTIVNSLDWSVMSGQWNTNNPISDINRDGLVNSIDFSFLNKNWMQIGE